MITRDKNHPSVVAWSLLNEPETTNEAAVPYFKEVFDLANKLDMQKRPRTFALIMNSLPDTCKCYQFSDIIALNRYYGWYMKGGYEISVAEELFRKEMNAWKEKKLNKVSLNAQKTSKCSGQKRNRSSKKVHSMNEKEEKVRDSWINGEIKGIELKSFDFNTNDSEQV